jgi:hypothetical protein
MLSRPPSSPAIALAAGGAFDFGDMDASTAAFAPALLGMAAGGAVRGRFSEQTFRRVFLRRIAGARRSPRVKELILLVNFENWPLDKQTFDKVVKMRNRVGIVNKEGFMNRRQFNTAALKTAAFATGTYFW